MCRTGSIAFAQEEESDEFAWPKKLTGEKGEITIYQPQIESFAGDKLESRAAVSVKEAGKDEMIFGAMWFQGRMEFGPRALGGRSILGDARSRDMQTTLNLKIKFRESFRPFAPSVLREHVSDCFDLDEESPYMLVVAPVQESRRIPMDTSAFDAGDNDLLAAVRQARSDVPAVTHFDYSARVQTVDAETNPEYHALIAEFERQTGCAVVVNTSFNVRGEPIVCSPQDAYRCFMRTEMDLLVLEDCLLFKEEQPVREADESWKEEYELD